MARYSWIGSSIPIGSTSSVSNPMVIELWGGVGDRRSDAQPKPSTTASCDSTAKPTNEPLKKLVPASATMNKSLSDSATANEHMTTLLPATSSSPRSFVDTRAPTKAQTQPYLLCLWP